MKFWSRNKLNKLDWLTPQDVYCCTRLLYKVLLVSIFLIAMHKIKGTSMVDYAIHGYFISLIKCIIINASSNVHLSSKLHTFGQFQQLSCNIIHKSWHKKITNVDDLLVLCHRKKKLQNKYVIKLILRLIAYLFSTKIQFINLSWVINGWWHWFGLSDRLSSMVVWQP